MKQRLDDSFYLKEDRRDNPKECFKQSLVKIDDFIGHSFHGSHFSILDIGCATGDFLYHFQHSSKFSAQSSIFGADVRSDLLDTLNERLPNVKTSELDISSANSVQAFQSSIGESSFDITYMCGVNAIFDDCSWIHNISNLTSPQGFTLIFGPFGDSNYDVLVSVRHCDETTLRSGWNTISINTLRNELNKTGRPYKLEILPFVMPFDIPSSNDPLRAFTINTTELGRIQMNGLGLLRPQKFISIAWDV